ncbi:thioredoxin Y1, chloroplastic-like [Cornus florida]|uniref:thioredoxin Y1, chloroplastic-like n=1 Tax=Cornus florida TaxID=4283 RepID=UPI00289F9594|nr:thioredoxin Y1, chloroplastic-like [Cornus florida]
MNLCEEDARSCGEGIVGLPISTSFNDGSFVCLGNRLKQTFSSFDDLLTNSGKPALVDFYATWCSSFQFMAPILNEVCASTKDMIQVVKFDTEKYPSIADKYKIETLTTFIIFKDRESYDNFEGTLTSGHLIERIETSLKVKQ